MRQQSATFYGIGLLAILPLFLAIGIAILLSSMPNFPKRFLTQPSPAPTGQAQISVTPTGSPKTATLSLVPQGGVNASGQTTVNLEINTGGSPAVAVTAVQAEITFNAQLINVTGVSDGPFFPSPVNHLITTVDNSVGRIFYTWGISPTGTAPSGQGIVATFQIEQIQRNGTTSTPFNFASQTFVTTPGGGASDIVQTKNNATITINP